MRFDEISIFFPEARLSALQKYLDKEGTTVSEKLCDYFMVLYGQYVPEDELNQIEADIKAQDELEKAEAEARKRFGVFHIRDGGEDSYFKSEIFDSFRAVSYRYRLYDRGELSSNPKTFHDAFGETIPISEDEYKEHRADINTDSRVLAVFDLDLDEGTAAFCQNKENEWSMYNLHHVSTAAYQAQRGGYKPSEERDAIFENYLSGKEIEIPDDSEAPVMQM